MKMRMSPIQNVGRLHRIKLLTTTEVSVRRVGPRAGENTKADPDDDRYQSGGTNNRIVLEMAGRSTVGHRFPIDVRVAKVPVQQVAEIDEVLHRQRTIQPEQLRELSLGRWVEVTGTRHQAYRVPGKHVEQQEVERHHGKQRRHQRDDLAK